MQIEIYKAKPESKNGVMAQLRVRTHVRAGVNEDYWACVNACPLNKKSRDGGHDATCVSGCEALKEVK